MQAHLTPPEDVASTAIERIVIAAEVEFAERGFEGAGMKAISSRAGVSQALLHYHFGSKDQLYAEVVRRRSDMINAERLALLDQVDLTSRGAIDGVLEALFRPPLGPAGGDQAYTRIFGGLIVGREREQALVKQHYDPTAQRFVMALARAVPGLDRAAAGLAYTLSLGVMVGVISRDGRVERLMGHDGRLELEEVLAHLVTFARGGIMTLVADRKSENKNGRNL